jgi:hypothetical protein
VIIWITVQQLLTVFLATAGNDIDRIADYNFEFDTIGNEKV